MTAMTQQATGASRQPALNSVQQKIVQTTEGPVLVFAGAGSGKTRVITHRISWLLSELGVRPDSILALTFTKKASKEMQERISKLLGGKERPLRWMGTFHSCMGQILRRESKHLGFKAPFVVIDEIDRLKLVRQIINRWPAESRTLKPAQAARMISRVKTYPHIARENLFSELQLPLIENLMTSYEAAMQECCGLDFDDLLLRALQLLRERPDILSLYQAKFKYLFVDEFQDTNVVQYELLKLLAGKQQNICVVGDDDQSIYGWRGAEVENILRFREDFSGAQMFRLEQNYRSTGNILKAAQSVVARNMVRQEKELWTQRDTGDPCSVIYVESDRDEAAKVVKEIQQRRDAGTGLGKMAILYRTNAQSRVLEEALRMETMPYTIVGGIRFYERKEIKDVLAYFQLMLNPRSSVALSRIINFPARGVGKVTLDKLADLAESLRLSQFEAIPKLTQRTDVNQRARNSLASFHALITKYRGLLKSVSITEWARTLVDELKLHQMYKEDGSPEAEERWDNIQELLNGLSEFTKSETDASLESFLQHVALLSDVDRWHWSPEAVTMMTIHSAKGLEFDTVFMTGLEEGLFPLFRTMETPEAMEEERRLFYVGATRAMNTLYITSARTRYRNGQLERSSTSRFLSEIDSSCVAEIHDRPAPKLTRMPSTKSNKPHTRIPLQAASTPSPFSEGQTVRHDHFGIGLIQLVEGSGDQTKVTVRFNGAGVKKLLVKYAKLAVI
jgi:DNA helicase II / ATP-dependent DNA helicase PcrA